MADSFRRELTVVLSGDGKGLTATLKVSREEVTQLGEAVDGAAGKTRAASNDMQDSMRKAQAQFKATGDTANDSMRGMADTGLQVSTLLKGYFAFEFIKQGISQLLSAQVAMQQIHYTLLSATGSAQAADAAFAFVEQTSQRMGLSLQNAAIGFAQLSASASANGVAMADQQKLFTAYAQASTVLHLSTAQSQSALLALEQMFSKGTIQAQELRLQLGQAIPGVMPRFEAAVLQMMKGTSNANKTFDQLLDKGDLITKDMLPALIKALSESGTGWEEASQGLNANLNRLSTAWFKLKADVSGGLFSDAASAIAGTLASNLNAVAGAATSVAAAYLVAFSGRTLQSLVDWAAAQVKTVTTSVQMSRAASDAAAASLELAAANAKEAQSELAVTTQRSASIAELIAQSDVREAATAAEAAAANEAAQSMRIQVAASTAIVEANASRAASTLEASGTMVAAFAADSVAVAQAEAALAAYTTAEIRALEAMVLRDSAMANNVALVKQQQLVEAQLTAAQEANTAATVAQAEATTAAAAASRAASVATGLFATAGRTLLTLVGGWAGVFLLAAASIAYLATRQSEAQKATTDLTEVTDSLATAQGAVTDQALAQARAQLTAKQAMLEQAEASLKAREASQGFVTGAQNLDTMAIATAQASEDVQNLQGAVSNLTDQIRKSVVEKAFADNMNQLAEMARQSTENFDELRKSIGKQNDTMAEQVATFGKGKLALVQYQEAQAIATQATNADANIAAARTKTIQDAYAPLLKNAAALDALTASKKANTQATKDAKKDAEEELKRINDIASAYAKIANIEDTLAGKDNDPMAKAYADSAKSIRDLADAGGVLIKNGVSEAVVQAEVAKGIDLATAARNTAITAAKKELDVGGKLIEQIQQQAQLSTLSDRDQAIAQAGMDYETQVREKNLKLTQQQIDAEKQRVETVAAGAYDMKKAADEQRAVAQEYAGFWENSASSISKAFGDLLTGQTKSWKDFGKSLKSIAQQFVSDILSQFIRLRILGPLLSGAMGDLAGVLGITGDLSGSGLTQSANYYGSGSTIGTAANALGGGAAGTPSYASYLQNGLTEYKAYQWASSGGIWGGSSLGAGAGNVANVGVDASGHAVAFNPWAGSSASGPYGGSFSAGAYSVPYASIGGGVLGAYYGSQQGSGGVSTAAATVGYGALGAGIAGTAAGVAGGASLGAAATGAFGAAAASTSWIPVVGWIIAAIAAVDAVSGGKVFGTKFQAQSADSILSLSSNGASADSKLYEKRQGALFSGAKWRTVDQGATPELTAAAQQLYDSLEKSMVSGAQKLGVDVPAMINANLTTHVELNSKGQVKSTDYLVDYLGQTWKEATADAAAQRLGAEALITVVAKSAGDATQALAQQFRGSADTLADAAQTMLAAQTDIVHGNSLLALGTNATLGEVITFTQQMQQSGETLAAAYTRLMQASTAYTQFVAQFTPTSNTFGASLEAIAKTMQANITQANALAVAAGLQGASEQDLSNIHQQAAQQAADAIAQLSSAAQDLAAKLYDVTGASLTAVNAQIDKLTDKVKSAAQMAIGDNSPLSDQDKLKVALEGLRSGITSADDVLALGRKLYSSSADYTGLYNKVQDILQLPGAGDTGTTGIDSAIAQYTQLTSQRDTLQSQADATQRFTDAKTLAQYVEEISTTHGIGYNDAASGLGFSLSDLAKDLGVTNISSYLDSLKLQDIPGSTLDASDSIVDAIQQLGRDLITTITGGPITSATLGSGTTTVTTTDPAQLALLQSIDARLAAIEGSSGTTATTNTAMAKQGTSAALASIAGSTRSSA